MNTIVTNVANAANLAQTLYCLGYDYGAIMSYAQIWECSIELAMAKLADIHGIHSG